MRYENQAIFLCRIAQSEATDFKIDGRIIGKIANRSGIDIGMLVLGVELLNETRDGFTQSRELLFFDPQGGGFIAPQNPHAKRALARLANRFSVDCIYGCKVKSGLCHEMKSSTWIKDIALRVSHL
jgi:hypothetical protein